MNSKALRIPLSIAAAGVLAFGFDISLDSDEWQLVGSGMGVDVENLVGTYEDAAGSGCANDAVISAWRFVNDGSTTSWQTRNCYVDTETLGYTLLTNTSNYEGMWVHASSTGGDVTANEVDAADATSLTVYDGWNMLANGDDEIEFDSQTQYALLKDTTNSVKVYRYDDGTWEVWSPNGLSGSYTEADGLEANEGYWVYVDSGKTYSTDLTTGDSSNSLDNDSDYLADNPVDLGGDDVNISDEVTGNAGKKFEFETDIFTESVYVSTDTNSTTAATMLDQNMSNLLTELNASSPTDYKVNPVITTLVQQAQTLYNRVSLKGYISTGIKTQAGTLRSLAIDLNNSINQEKQDGMNISQDIADLNTSYDYLFLASLYATGYDNNLSKYSLYSLDSNITAQQRALNALGKVETYFEMAQDAYDSVVASGADADDIVTAAESLYSLLYDANASQPTGITVSTTTERVKTVNEVNQTVSMVANASFGHLYGSSTETEYYRLTVVIPDVGTLETDVNASTGGKLHQEINSTIQSNTSFTPYLYISGEDSDPTNALGALGIELNITGKTGIGAFTISIASLEDDSNESNDWTASNTGVNSDYDLNLTTVEDYVAFVSGVRKVVKVTVDQTFSAGDEFNITGGELDSTMAIGTGMKEFWDSNLTFTLDSDDIKSTEALTRYAVATRIAKAIDGNESNLTASASGNVVTITTSTLNADSYLLYDDYNGSVPSNSDTNNSREATADFEIEIQVNGIDYNTMLTESDTLVETATQMEVNLTAIVTDDDNTTNKTFSGAETAILYASDTLDAVINGTSSSANAGTVYTDDYARMYWDLEGVSSTTSCSTSAINAIDGWRLPTMSDVISLYDLSDGKVVDTISSASVTSGATNIFTDDTAYIITSATDSGGDYYAVNVSDLDDIITDDGAGSSGETVYITCVADFYDNDSTSAETQFHDYYYYTDVSGSTNRLTQDTTNGYVQDDALSVYWYLAESTAQWSPLSSDGKLSSWSDANTWCTALGYQLPTLSELRSLNLYDIKARYDNAQSTMGLNRSGMFSLDFNDSTIGYWTQTSDSDGNYYIVSPSMDVNYTNMNSWTSAATADDDGYRVICVKAQ